MFRFLGASVAFSKPLGFPSLRGDGIVERAYGVRGLIWQIRESNSGEGRPWREQVAKTEVLAWTAAYAVRREVSTVCVPTGRWHKEKKHGNAIVQVTKRYLPVHAACRCVVYCTHYCTDYCNCCSTDYGMWIVD